jgi:hypothetical protein
MKQILGGVVLLLVGVAPVFAQTPPPNDNFSNRIVLSGTSLTFSGTLAGATLESNEPLGGTLTNIAAENPTQSVWWTWTAPQSSLVILEMTGASFDTVGSGGGSLAGCAIYDTTNIFAGAEPITNMTLDLSRLCPTLTFEAEQGSNYQIQMIGNNSTAYQMFMVATNPPVILQQPRNLTISAGESTLFTVVADGYRPWTYQWQFNGTDLPGQTVAMLALTNVDPTMAGSYSVVVSNSGGVVSSAPGLLTVDTSNTPPSLAVGNWSPAELEFQLTGEIGRNYRIETSSDLNVWSNEVAFDMTPYELSSEYGANSGVLTPNLTSVVFNTNGLSTLDVAGKAPEQFWRAVQYKPANEICINNLRQIRFAKLLWRRRYPQFFGRYDTPQGPDLAPFFPQGVLPFCPNDSYRLFVTSYIPNNEETTPQCNVIASHVLEEAQ